MRRGLLGAALAVGLATLASPPVAARSTIVARTTAGAVRGAASGDVVAFKGIPYAAAPVGALRWRAPQPPRQWSGTREATRYGADCMQEPFPGDYAPIATRPAEDCLYANVWRPAGSARRLPVMVWIHGGGFVNGGASPAVYAGDGLARRGIVVISFNYRLGRFGTFAHPALTRARADGDLIANYGELDQIAAMRWVKANAAAFGGDPGNVTVVGESAGGMAIHMLLTSPLAHGLVRRAVIQSGGPLPASDPDMRSAEAVGITFAKTHGIATDDPGAADRLRALSAEVVTDRLNMTALFAPVPGPRTFGGPIADGRSGVDADSAYASGAFAHVPVMLGVTTDDIGGATGVMAKGVQRIADRLAVAGLPVYRYRFGYVAGSARAAFPNGAGHATEIPFFFSTERVRYGNAATDADRRAATLASGYLVNFVKTGDPNGAKLPRWIPYSPARPAIMTFTPEAGARLARGDSALR